MPVVWSTGSLTKVYVRYATNRDVKELAKRTKGEPSAVHVSTAARVRSPHQSRLAPPLAMPGPRHMFGKRARKPKRPRAPREVTEDDRKKSDAKRKRQAEQLDDALDSYRTHGRADQAAGAGAGAGVGAGAGAAGGPTDAAAGTGGDVERQGPAKRRRGRGLLSVSTDAMEDIVGAGVLATIELRREQRRPRTQAEKLQALDDALAAYNREPEAPAVPVAAPRAPASDSRGAKARGSANGGAAADAAVGDAAEAEAEALDFLHGGGSDSDDGGPGATGASLTMDAADALLQTVSKQ